MNRRNLIASLLVLVPHSLFVGTCKSANADEKAKFVWHLPSDRLVTAKEYLGEHLNEEPENNNGDRTRGLPLYIIISAVALIPDLAEAVVRVYRDYEDGGVLITSKHGTFEISTDRRLPPDLVIVKSDQGVTVYQASHPSAYDLLSPMKSIINTKK